RRVLFRSDHATTHDVVMRDGVLVAAQNAAVDTAFHRVEGKLQPLGRLVRGNELLTHADTVAVSVQFVNVIHLFEYVSNVTASSPGAKGFSSAMRVRFGATRS